MRMTLKQIEELTIEEFEKMISIDECKKKIKKYEGGSDMTLEERIKIAQERTLKERYLRTYIKEKINAYLYDEIIHYDNLKKEYKKMEKIVKEDMEYIIEAIYDIVKDLMFVDLSIIHIFHGSKDIDFKFIVPQEGTVKKWMILDYKKERKQKNESI